MKLLKTIRAKFMHDITTLVDGSQHCHKHRYVTAHQVTPTIRIIEYETYGWNAKLTQEWMTHFTPFINTDGTWEVLRTSSRMNTRFETTNAWKPTYLFHAIEVAKAYEVLMANQPPEMHRDMFDMACKMVAVANHPLAHKIMPMLATQVQGIPVTD